jgi:tRNA-Thr(GGU) m(6)t(6)A37 methyltransferase TsaA
MSSNGKVVLEPVGFVKTKAVGKKVRDKNVISQIVFREELTEALEGIQEFSHIFVLFWLHEIEEKAKGIMKVHPRGRKDIPLLGIFATRTPYRPNPIGLTRVKLLDVEGNVVTVQGLDAFDGTPVLDIKPFDHWDTTDNVRVPEWWLRMEKERTKKRENSK